jgi:hypothetical protein
MIATALGALGRGTGMIATALGALGTVFGAVKANWIYYAVIAVLALALLGAIWRMDHLSGALALEKSEHKATQEALAREVEKGMGWKTAYENALERAAAQGQATQACLDREVAAAAAREERAAILQAAQPRLRTEQERQQVVNDETRKRAADRLNRPW